VTKQGEIDWEENPQRMNVYCFHSTKGLETFSICVYSAATTVHLLAMIIMSHIPVDFSSFLIQSVHASVSSDLHKSMIITSWFSFNFAIEITVWVKNFWMTSFYSEEQILKMI